MAKDKLQDYIIRMAAEAGTKAALEAYAKEKEKEKKRRSDRRLRDTKRLMKNYREIKIHAGDAVTSLTEVEAEDYDFFQRLMEDKHDVDVDAIVSSKAKSAIMLAHIDAMLSAYQTICMGRPDSSEVWETLDDVVNHEYSYADGITLRPSITFVDEGGHFTQDVRMRCRERFSRKVFCIKGSNGGDGVPYTAPPKKQKIVVNGKAIGTCWQYAIGVDAGKQLIMAADNQASGAQKVPAAPGAETEVDDKDMTPNQRMTNARAEVADLLGKKKEGK